jgi:hypothetical protein
LSHQTVGEIFIEPHPVTGAAPTDSSQIGFSKAEDHQRELPPRASSAFINVAEKLLSK